MLPRSAIRSVLWERRIPIFNQGATGACTGYALVGVLGTDSAERAGARSVTVKADPFGVFTAGRHTLDEAFAVKVYSLNTRTDPFAGTFPPHDTGSNGLAAGATGKTLGLLDSYTHAFSMDALRTALQSGPVMWGTLWLRSMYDVDRDGFLIVDRDSAEAGGHELVISGYDADEDFFTVQNSWGTEWGTDGYARVRAEDMAWLLAQDGDVTVPHLASPEASATSSADETLLRVFVAWAKAKGMPV
ncbi:C1 family peptidase [Streptomyces sp. NPDC101221]|uniref:C1 family peptidase n=1 Tax=Streptomyces sp. NPDC101221 TaxID=3366132 RepID=UPI0037F104A1